MSAKPRYSRIAITIPAADLAAADAIARKRDRSRSWVIAEAVRRYASEPAPPPPRPRLGPPPTSASPPKNAFAPLKKRRGPLCAAAPYTRSA